MTTLLLPDQTYGDEFHKSLKHRRQCDDKSNNTINNLYRKTKSNETKKRQKTKNMAKFKGKCNSLQPEFRLNAVNPKNDIENYYKLGFDDGSVNDNLSVYSFTSESENEIFSRADPQFVNDGYSQEMSRLLKGIKVWETTCNTSCDTNTRKQTCHQIGGSESLTNKNSLNHNRSTSFDSFRARQNTKKFLSKNNIRPEFFCQYKHMIG